MRHRHVLEGWGTSVRQRREEKSLASNQTQRRTRHVWVLLRRALRPWTSGKRGRGLTFPKDGLESSTGSGRAVSRSHCASRGIWAGAGTDGLLNKLMTGPFASVREMGATDHPSHFRAS